MSPHPFVALDGAPRKVEEIKKLVPPWMETRYPSLIGALLTAIGLEDHRFAVGERTAFIRGANPTGNLRYVSTVDDPSIRIRHLVPTVNPSSLSVTVSGKDITVNLATDSAASITSTAAQVKAAVDLIPAAVALVTTVLTGDGAEYAGEEAQFLPLMYEGLEGARADIFLSSAIRGDLSVIGLNYGVLTPLLLGLTDEQMRLYIAVMAWKKKLNRASIEGLLTVVFGPKETGGWEVYEIRKKTITIEVTLDLLPAGPSQGSYLRPSPLQNSTNYYTGDYLLPNATYPFIKRVKPTSVSALSPVTNNSLYASAAHSNRPALLDVLKLIRAAGIKVEMRQRRD